ncbi:MAG: Fe-S protein assembly co-chaperone HscB [Mesosutterella sp.]|nr:Fe-S protein assembly co-chaperone HscB [Mesosutterella sp.]
MALTEDYFELFGLPARFRIDGKALEEAFRRIELEVHPDRFAGASPAMKRVAEQWSVRANEAHSVLSNPLSRAVYLCGRMGVPVDAENSTRMPVDFLMQQMDWRERFEAAKEKNDAKAMQSLAAAVAAEDERLTGEIASALDDQKDPKKAAELVRRLMFVDKMARELSSSAACSNKM